MVFTIAKSHPVKAFKSRNVITEFGLKYAILVKNQKAGIVSTLPIACNLQSPLKMEWNGLLYHVWFDTFFKPNN